MRVFIVWEPILATDFSPPFSAVLHLAPDPRVRQYWDPQKRVAARMAADARPPQPTQDCCDRAGVLWDIAAVYPPGPRWEAQLPPATVFNGPVVDVVDAIDAAMKR